MVGWLERPRSTRRFALPRGVNSSDDRDESVVQWRVRRHNCMPDESTPSAPASLGRRVLMMTAKIVVSAALLAFLFSKIDTARPWASARSASVPWLIAALGVYFVNMLASTWRWRLLLHAQDVNVPGRTLLGSYLVATFFNNFLPSNIGGDVIRIRDTAVATQSKTLATTVVLVDRGMGLLGLVLIVALGATVAADPH